MMHLKTHGEMIIKHRFKFINTSGFQTDRIQGE